MLQSFLDFLNAPFTSGMTAAQWFLFIGLIVISLMLWHTIMQTLLGEI